MQVAAAGGFTAAEPGGSGVNVQGWMGGHVDVHGTLLGNITGLLLATTNIPECIRGGFPVFGLVFAWNRVHEPVTNGPGKEKASADAR